MEQPPEDFGASPADAGPPSLDEQLAELPEPEVGVSPPADMAHAITAAEPGRQITNTKPWSTGDLRALSNDDLTALRLSISARDGHRQVRRPRRNAGRAS